jgi:hypothetical protein
VQQDDALLYAWLQAHSSYDGDAAGAYAYFQTLPGDLQNVFLRQLYFSLLNTSGVDFNAPSNDLGLYKTYILGQQAIAALFPSRNPGGQPIAYNGAITMFGSSGILTDLGGTIETLTPGGATTVGVEGPTPIGTAGILTQGTGDIDMYALDSVELGESRVLTTFGGNVLIWSAQGDINAGRGTKTTIIYAPEQVIYDNYGDIFLSPSVPSSGAGIGTLNPIPSVAPGDVNAVLLDCRNSRLWRQLSQPTTAAGRSFSRRHPKAKEKTCYHRRGGGQGSGWDRACLENYLTGAFGGVTFFINGIRQVAAMKATITARNASA